MEVAVLGGGCFWCMEALFQRVKGVEQVKSGYTGGFVPDPKYQDVKKGITGHIEVIKVVYDPQQIRYQDILEIFMHVHDPTQENGQGEDIGSQYLSAIFYLNEQQRNKAIQAIRNAQQQLEMEISGQPDPENSQENKNGTEKNKRIVTLIRKLQEFYFAQVYHQNYFNQKGGQNPYCNIIPSKIAKMRKHFKQKTVQQKEVKKQYKNS